MDKIEKQGILKLSRYSSNSYVSVFLRYYEFAFLEEEKGAAFCSFLESTRWFVDFSKVVISYVNLSNKIKLFHTEKGKKPGNSVEIMREADYKVWKQNKK